MLPHLLRRLDGSTFCSHNFDEANNWLLVTWKGFVGVQDAERGAQEALRILQLCHVPYLLNDNSQVAGPWFDSVEWLERVWAPQAARLGLRCVAHVLQADANAELALTANHNPFAAGSSCSFFPPWPKRSAGYGKCSSTRPKPAQTSLSCAGGTR
ncbi:hypothetical protein BEN47_00510 [Hymenobacter lapidarius]|uniref:Uncharacterized protein n=1 Tax=Hymenobacter lapidarius TaxID=1908237 RepID=A0A1G1T9Z1_9BACT|nr:hypothetical protein [Hymenobacter lapidarius]OGX87682.1 hypothetical protein BEN47_00510 [Hymenobacter lapidarius]